MTKNSNEAEHTKCFKDALSSLEILIKKYNYAGVATMLRNIEGFGSINATTVFRWHKSQSKHRFKTEMRMIEAANALEDYAKSPVVLRFAAVKQASEMLPILLLADLPDIEKELGIRVEVKELDSVAECIAALRLKDENGADACVVPQHTEFEPRDKNLERFFRIADIGVSGIFSKFDISLSVPQNIDRLCKSPQGCRIGSLANANYEEAINEILKKYNSSPEYVPVSRSEKALEMLLSKEIDGVVGHPVFIANIFAPIRNFKKHNSAFQLVLGMSTHIKMDVVISHSTKPATARHIFEALTESVDYIKNNIGITIFEDKVERVLGLEGKHYGAKQIIENYDFSVQTFETKTLRRVWR